MAGAPPLPSTAATSNRASFHEPGGIVARYALAAAAILLRLAGPTDSSGSPCPSSSRKRTSTNARTSLSRAMTSISPPRARKFRSTISIPLSRKYAQTDSSASRPAAALSSGLRLTREGPRGTSSGGSERGRATPGRPDAPSSGTPCGGEAVPGGDPVELEHQPVPGDFRDDGGRHDRNAPGIPRDDRFLADGRPWASLRRRDRDIPVDVEKVRNGYEFFHRPAHREKRRLEDIDPVDLLRGGMADRVGEGVGGDKRKGPFPRFRG